jgi:hypothetical protein
VAFCGDALLRNGEIAGLDVALSICCVVCYIEVRFLLHVALDPAIRDEIERLKCW